MKFEEVLPALREGKKIKRKEWPWSYDLNLLTRNPSLKPMMGIVEALANDWEIVDESN